MIKSLDHLVLTVKDMDATIDFYTRVLGMSVVTFENGRKALRFGQQKINLHQQGHEIEPKAQTATAGSADLCFLSDMPVDALANHLQAEGVTLLFDAPVSRTGTNASLQSLYLRDPDGNLIEIANEI